MAELHLLTLPIGNMDDITTRVLHILKSQRSYFVEDTRSFKNLISHLGFSIRDYTVRTFHDHTQEQTNELILLLDKGEDIYYASEAGSPIISDPAFPLVRLAIEKGHKVRTYPGVTAPITALELSGLPPHPFTFHGFLPREESRKRELLKSLTPAHTHIFFEGVARVEKSLDLVSELLPVAQVSLCRELTKKFEETLRFKGEQWPEIRESLVLKGEFVLLIYPERLAGQQASASSSKLVSLAEAYLGRPSTKALAKLLASVLNLKVNEVYTRLSRGSLKEGE